MAISTEDFVKQIETMSVLDLSNLVHALEDRFVLLEPFGHFAVGEPRVGV